MKKHTTVPFERKNLYEAMIDFNLQLCKMYELEDIPVLERYRFHHIAYKNLKEFCQYKYLTVPKELRLRIQKKIMGCFDEMQKTYELFSNLLLIPSGNQYIFQSLIDLSTFQVYDYITDIKTKYGMYIPEKDFYIGFDTRYIKTLQGIYAYDEILSIYFEMDQYILFEVLHNLRFDNRESEYAMIYTTKKLDSTIDQIIVEFELIGYDEIFPYIEEEYFDSKYVYTKLDPVYEKYQYMNLLQEEDMIVYSPYDSYQHVLDFIDEICTSDQIDYIFQTLYRLKDGGSKIVDSLCKAASLGKKVIVNLEYGAAGNENSNNQYADILIQAGCIVNNINKDTKIHCKMFLGIGKDKSYAAISTGNFNEATSKIYTDLTLLTSNPFIIHNLENIFHLITSDKENLNQFNLSDPIYILFSPNNLRYEIIQKIHAEARKGKNGRIYIKCNNLEDPEIINALELAICKGCVVRLFVRTVTGLLSDQFQSSTRRKIGQFLEHDRIYIFGDEVWMGSADLMTRNTSKRYELLVRLMNEKAANYVKDIFFMNWNDIDNIFEYDDKKKKFHRITE